ncbi:MAG: hypothetical protein SFY96_10705 [Planctomycetota bacterium]|nr:hypothetical protein [Planctomycetota bacterium]
MSDATTSRRGSNPDSPGLSQRLFGGGSWLALAFAVGACLVIFSGNRNGRAASDMINYHEPAIRTFAQQWPAFDFSDYLSATTPGYHIVLATVARWVNAATPALQLAGLLFSLRLISTLAGFAARRRGPLDALLLAAPFAASLYVFVSGAYLLPDNAGWLGVLLVLAVALRDTQTWGSLALGGVALAALVFTRQIHIWAAAPLWIAAFVHPPVRAGASVALSSRVRAAVIAFAFTLPAFGVLAAFARLWGGLTPPMFKEFHASGINPAAPAFLLSLIGGLSVVFARWWWPALRDLHRTWRWAVPAAAVVGLGLAIVPATTYDQQAGRWAGVLWDVSKRLPVLAGHTAPIFVVLAPLGAVVLAALLTASSKARPGMGWVLLVTLLAFTAAQAASYQLWQRYNEPFALMFLALACALVPDPNPAQPGGIGRTLRWLPLVMALGFAAMTGWKVTHDAPAGTFDVLKPRLEDLAPGQR